MAIHAWALALQSSTDGTGVLFSLILLAVMVFLIASFWKVFTKAGQPGWASIIPIYNAIVWLRIAGRPGWWIILLLIPIVGFVIAIVVSIDFAKKFGKGAGFAMGLVFLGFIFYPILAWGSAKYSRA
ncbi:MAG: DUF5684 domain-containing protein [Acidobacteria bacterium]|nr:DUF5684 domain-containing protein [Acidobacteriota bacterium]